MITRVQAIVSTELRIALRNHWLITAVTIMTVFSLVLALAGSAPAGTLGLDRLTITVSGLATLSVYLVPLIGLLLSYDAFAGEVERGTLPLILTCPVSRIEIVAGKFAAQLLVLSIAVVVGFGLTALLLWAGGGASPDGFRHLVRLLLSAIVLGAGFIAMGFCLSIVSRQPGTAASMAVGVWLVTVVLLDIALLGALVADDGGMFTKSVFPWLLVASPTDAFRLINLAALDPGAVEAGIGGAAHTLNLPPLFLIASLVAWPVALLVAATAVFQRFEP